jgi:hypothetical protein
MFSVVRARSRSLCLLKSTNSIMAYTGTSCMGCRLPDIYIIFHVSCVIMQFEFLHTHTHTQAYRHSHTPGRFLRSRSGALRLERWPCSWRQAKATIIALELIHRYYIQFAELVPLHVLCSHMELLIRPYTIPSRNFRAQFIRQGSSSYRQVTKLVHKRVASYLSKPWPTLSQALKHKRLCFTAI